jgi:HEAT repeat protein
MQAKLDPQTIENIVATVKGRLKDLEFKWLALRFLADIEETSIIPDLIKTIKETPYCAGEVDALVKLRPPRDPTVQAVLKEVLRNEKYASDARLSAAFALAWTKDQDGIAFLSKILKDGSSWEEDVLRILNFIGHNPNPEFLPAVLARFAHAKRQLEAIKEYNYQKPYPPLMAIAVAENEVILFNALIVASRIMVMKKDDPEKIRVLIQEADPHLMGNPNFEKFRKELLTVKSE